ncbi:MAG: hypothetical protein V2A54_04020, partial [Bacteroidota bacterium]
MKKLLAIFVVASVAFASCTTVSHSMKEPSNNVEFKKEDFELSKQVSGEATQVKILQVLDVSRLFYKELGETVSPGGKLQIPIIGGMLAK